MALNGKISKGGDEKEIFEVQFTNGTVSQLKDLALFLQQEGLTMPDDDEKKLAEVVRIGISWLERLRENSKKGKNSLEGA